MEILSYFKFEKYASGLLPYISKSKNTNETSNSFQHFALLI